MAYYRPLKSGWQIQPTISQKTATASPMPMLVKNPWFQPAATPRITLPANATKYARNKNSRIMLISPFQKPPCLCLCLRGQKVTKTALSNSGAGALNRPISHPKQS